MFFMGKTMKKQRNRQDVEVEFKTNREKILAGSSTNMLLTLFSDNFEFYTS